MYKALDVSLDNIVDIDNLLRFSIGLEKKCNQIIHPTSTADISHMVNQFIPGKLSDKLIRDIANPQISGLDKQSLMGALTPGVTEFQNITDRLQGSLPLSELRVQNSILEEQQEQKGSQQEGEQELNVDRLNREGSNKEIPGCCSIS